MMKVGGMIARFKLEDWWLATFTDAERSHIQATYKPLGMGTVSLADGEISFTSQKPDELLYALSGWFKKTEQDVSIARRLVAKAEEIAKHTDAWDYHNMLGRKVRFLTDIQASDDEILAAAMQQIAQGQQKYISSSDRFDLAANHAGFDAALRILSNSGRYNEAVQLAQQAKNQGWPDYLDADIVESLLESEEIDRAMLEHIGLNPGCIQSELAAVRSLANFDCSYICYCLEKRGAIVRVKKGRSYQLYLPKSTS